jgi:hypothetical protein
MFGATQAFLFLALMSPLLLVLWDQADFELLNVVLVGLILLISSVRLAQAIGPGRSRMLAVTFYAFVYCFLGIATLGQVVTRRYPLDGYRYDDSIVTQALLIVLLGIAGYELGVFLASRGAPMNGEAVRDAGAKWGFSRRRVTILGLFGLLVVAYTVSRYGLSPFFESRDAAGQARTGRTGVTQRYAIEDKRSQVLLSNAFRVPVFMSLYGMLLLKRHGRWVPRSPLDDLLSRAFLVALIGGNVIANNPVGNSRSWFGTLLVALLSVYVSFRRPAGVRVLAVGSLVVLLFAFTSLDAFRWSGPSQFESTGPRESLVTDGSYSAFQTNVNGVMYVQDEGHTSGHQTLSSALAMVPRVFWPGKAENTGGVIDPKYNRSATMWTEFYVDFGFPGVVILFSLYGWVSVRFERRFSGSSYALAAFVPVLTGYQIFLLRGSLLPAMGTIYFLTGALIFMLSKESSRADLEWRPPKPSQHLIRAS